MLLDDRFNVEIVNGRMQSQLNSLATRVNLQLEAGLLYGRTSWSSLS